MDTGHWATTSGISSSFSVDARGVSGFPSFRQWSRRYSDLKAEDKGTQSRTAPTPNSLIVAIVAERPTRDDLSC